MVKVATRSSDADAPSQGRRQIDGHPSHRSDHVATFCPMSFAHGRLALCRSPSASFASAPLACSGCRACSGRRPSCRRRPVRRTPRRRPGAASIVDAPEEAPPPDRCCFFAPAPRSALQALVAAVALLGRLAATLRIAEALALVARLRPARRSLLVAGAAPPCCWRRRLVPAAAAPFAAPLAGRRIALLALLVAVPLDLVVPVDAGAIAVELVGVDLVADVDVAGVDVDVVAAAPAASLMSMSLSFQSNA